MEHDDEKQQKENNLLVMDIISNLNNDNNQKQKLNIPEYNNVNSDSKEAQETLDEEDESKQSLNPKNNDLVDMNDSGIIQIPMKYDEPPLPISNEGNNFNSTEDEYKTPLTSKTYTLDEAISATILRDIRLIYYKLKHVINPLSSNIERQRHIIEWDLWGPLIFITLLSCTLAIKAKDKSKIIVIIFSIFWFGSLLIYVNGNLLDSKLKFFQVICLLGYCLFPLNISALILAITDFYEIIRLFLVIITCAWSLFSVERYFSSVSVPEQKWLVFYPAILMFVFLSWFIFTMK